MAQPDRKNDLDEAFDRIEETILRLTATSNDDRCSRIR